MFRIGLVSVFHSTAEYRVRSPGQMLEKRGHQVVWPADLRGDPDLRALSACDAVLVWRRCDPATYRLLAALAARGIAIVFDIDDDLLTMPEARPGQSKPNEAGRRAEFARAVRLAHLASAMTVTTEPLARQYRDAGVENVHVVPNLLRYGSIRQPRPHEGFVVGWLAGVEHHVDAARIPIADALERLLAKHRDVSVECIGVDLGLSTRYAHREWVNFFELPDTAAGWDVAIAPLADTAFNRARSDIKLKEYAACGVPWLASPVGPYVGLGEKQGGRLVEDGQWFDALNRMVRKRRERERLSAAGHAWAKTQSIAGAFDRYEQIIGEAIARTRARSSAGRAERVSS
jgi:glycosyltransferase involved in cell wall biosynthesis